jgi:hypothetical protein
MVAQTDDWKKVTDSILAGLDIAAEYEAMGVRFADGGPRASGWRSCHAVGREDRNPSAEVCVGSGPGRGRYRDYGDGTKESIGLFDFAADVVGRFPCWRLAREHFAAKAGVELPKSEEAGRPKDSFRFRQSIAPGILRLFCRAKTGILPSAILECGALGANWPSSQPIERQQGVLAFPCWGPDGFSADPVGYHCCGDTGAPIQKWAKGDKKPTPIKTMQRGSPGLINTWAVANWQAAETVWVVEGLTDLLALHGAVGPRQDHVCVTMGGVSYHPTPEIAELFRSKKVRLVFDVDPPSDKFPAGQGAAGAAQWLQALVPIADEVKNLRLPYHGLREKRDLRDWLCEGHGFDDLLELAERFAAADQASASKEFAKLARDRTIQNFVSAATTKGESGVQHLPLPPSAIAECAASVVGNWPKQVGGIMFTHQGGSQHVDFIGSPSDLFGFYHSRGKVNWRNTDTDKLTKSEFFSYMKTNAPVVGSLEQYPHFPRHEDAYYLGEPPPAGDGSHLRDLLDQFNPASPEDWDLMYACVLTLFWGGPAGAKPSFLFTSVDGRGAGKTTTAQMLASLVGGAFRFSKNEPIETINKRLLTSDALTTRVCLVDNVKASRFSWVDFEALVTADTISGHKMYVGDSTRPNRFTWFLTLNGPALGTDIAQRSIVIELKKPKKYASTWLEDTARYIEEHRSRIIGDVRAALEQPPVKFEIKTRWGAWAAQVIGRTYAPEGVQFAILERQAKYDVEVEECADIESGVSERLAWLGYDPEVDSVFIPSSVLAKIVGEALGQRITPTGATRLVNQAIGEGKVTRMRAAKLQGGVRGMTWHGNGMKAGVWKDMSERLGRSYSRMGGSAF